VPPCTPPSGQFFCIRGEYVTMSNGVFNFNFLALLLSKILGGPNLHYGALRLVENFFTQSEFFTIVFFISTF